MNASEFKAKCLAILDEVSETGEGVTILKRGRPVAQLVPAAPGVGPDPRAGLIGTVKILGDIVAPVVEPAEWEAIGRSRG